MAKVVDWNPDLESGQAFFRTYLAMMRASGKSPNFGDAFETLVGQEPPKIACAEFLLCQENATMGFKLSKPIGLTDILRYTL